MAEFEEWLSSVKELVVVVEDLWKFHKLPLWGCLMA